MSEMWARVGSAARPRFNFCNEATKHLIVAMPYAGTDRVLTGCGMAYRLSEVTDPELIDRPCARCERRWVKERRQDA